MDGPGEADGLTAMVAHVKKKSPNIEFLNAAIPGGSGTQAKAVLASTSSPRPKFGHRAYGR